MFSIFNLFYKYNLFTTREFNSIMNLFGFYFENVLEEGEFYERKF